MITETTTTSQVIELTFIWPDGVSVGLSETEKKAVEAFARSVERSHSKFGYTEASIDLLCYPKKTHPIIPRTIVCTKKHFIVALNGHNGAPVLSGGAQQARIKLAYDPLNGQWLVKKKIHNPIQLMLINRLMHVSYESANKSGFAQIAAIQPNLQTYYEIKYDCDLSTWHSKHRVINVNLNSIIELQNAVKTMHLMKYRPAELEYYNPDKPTELLGSVAAILGGPVFHGDISPKNVLCNPNPNDETFPNLKLTDFGFSDFLKVGWLPGWGSPETIAFSRGDPKYSHMSVVEFNQKYGQKRDSWGMGLLVGSLLRNHLMNYSLPYFSFISEKVRVLPDGRLDDSQIVEITQEEIDTKIAEIKRQVQERYEGSLAKNLLAIWKIVNLWLTVDPDRRPTFVDASMVVVSPSTQADSQA